MFQTATASYTLIVENKVDPTLTFTSLSEDTVTVFLNNDPITYAVTARAPDNTPITGGTITYTSSNPEVATVDSDTGEVALLTVGQTTITATRAADITYNEATASYTLTVENKVNPTLTFTSLSEDTVTVFLNSDPITYTVTARAPDNTPITGGTITYTSSNPTVATVNSATGEVTLLTVGTTTITATRAADNMFQTATASYILTVDDKVDPILTFTSLSEDTVTVFLNNDPIAYTVTAQTPDNTPITGGTITYTSSNPTVATVNGATGELAYLTIGQTTITATRAEDDTYYEATASYALTVQPPSPPIIPETQSASVVHTLPLTEAIVIENTGASPSSDGCRFVDAADSQTTTTDTAGLSIAVSGNDCRITGTPQRSDQATAGTPEVVMLFIRAFNTEGSDWTTLTLTIAEPVIDLDDQADGVELTTGILDTITLVNSGNFVIADDGCDISPALPAGLTLEPTSDKRSCQITGTPNDTLITTPFTVTASNGSIADPTPALVTLAIRLPAMQIQAGESHSCLLNPTGEIWCWGNNSSGQLGIGDNLSRERPTRVGAETNWRSLIVGENHNCAINSSGELYCWGLGSSGRLGTGNNDSQNTPTRVGMQSDWVSVNADALHTCGIREDGADRTLYCWGGRGARLGTGDIDNNTVPAQVGTETDWLSVSAGASHTCGIRDDGGDQTLWCWGQGSLGRLGTGSFLSRPTPRPVAGFTSASLIDTGGSHTCALETTNSNNSLFCWGNVSVGRVGIGDVANFATTPQQTLFVIESLVTPSMLADALDTTAITFNLLGTHSWMAQTEQTNDNTDAAAATNAAENDLACITSYVENAGSLSFYWRVSSEMNSDFLNFYLNTFESRSISGIVDWIQVDAISVPEDSELRWCYEKDDNEMTANEDSAFLDQVVYTPR